VSAEFDFELPHLAAQRRLHHGEKRGGAREAPEFRDVAKVFELFQIHVPLGFMAYAYLLYQVYRSFLDSIRDNRPSKGPKSMQRSIPCLFMRGGTSRGPFFLESDLPSDVAQRDAILLSVMGSPDVRQIDGVGGADPLTSKVGMVRRGRTAGVDLEFLFAQVSVKEALVDTTPNCGNMLAAVVPFGIETGLVRARGRLDDAARADAQHRNLERYRGAYSGRQGRILG